MDRPLVIVALCVTVVLLFLGSYLVGPALVGH